MPSTMWRCGEAHQQGLVVVKALEGRDGLDGLGRGKGDLAAGDQLAAVGEHREGRDLADSVVADEQPLALLGGQRLGGGDERVEGGGRGDPGLGEGALAVVEHLDVVDHLDAVELPVDGHQITVALVEVVLGASVLRVECGDLAAAGESLREVAVLEDVGCCGGEQRRVELGRVVAGHPGDLDGDVRVRLGELGGVAGEGLLGAGLPIGVGPDVQGDLRSGRGAAGRAGGTADRRSGHKEEGSSEESSAAELGSLCAHVVSWRGDVGVRVALSGGAGVRRSRLAGSDGHRSRR